MAERSSQGAGHGEYPGPEQFDSESCRSTGSRGQADGLGRYHRYISIPMVDVEKKEYITRCNRSPVLYGVSGRLAPKVGISKAPNLTMSRENARRVPE